MHIETMIRKARKDKDPRAEALTRLLNAGFDTEEQICEAIGAEFYPGELTDLPKKKGKK